MQIPRVDHPARTVELTLTFRDLDRHDLGKLGCSREQLRPCRGGPDGTRF